MKTTITMKSTTESSSMASTATTYQPPIQFCNNKKIGNYPDPMRCDGYITCVHGRAIFMKCPGELHFNSDLGVCDWHNIVNCSKGGYVKYTFITGISYVTYCDWSRFMSSFWKTFILYRHDLLKLLWDSTILI